MSKPLRLGEDSLREFGSRIAERAINRALGDMEADSQLALDRTEQLQRIWRHRVSHLESPIEDSPQCFPTYREGIRQPGWFCRRQHVCPFCFGRRIADLTKVLMRAVTELRPTTSIEVLLQRQAVLLPYSKKHRTAFQTGEIVVWEPDDRTIAENAYRKICDEFSQARYWRETYLHCFPEAVGGIFLQTISPMASGWQISVRRVVIVPENAEFSWPGFRGSRVQQKTLRHSLLNPTSSNLARNLSWLWGYPRGWVRWPLLPILGANDDPNCSVHTALLPLELALSLPAPRMSGLYGSCRRVPLSP